MIRLRSNRPVVVGSCLSVLLYVNVAVVVLRRCAWPAGLLGGLAWSAARRAYVLVGLGPLSLATG